MFNELFEQAKNKTRQMESTQPTVEPKQTLREKAVEKRKKVVEQKNYKELAEKALVVRHLRTLEKLSDKEKAFVAAVEAIELTPKERQIVKEEMGKLMVPIKEGYGGTPIYARDLNPELQSEAYIGGYNVLKAQADEEGREIVVGTWLDKPILEGQYSDPVIKVSKKDVKVGDFCGPDKKEKEDDKEDK